MNPLTQEEKALLLEILKDRIDIKREQLDCENMTETYPNEAERQEVAAIIAADWEDLDRLIHKLGLDLDPPCDSTLTRLVILVDCDSCGCLVPEEEHLGYQDEYFCEACFIENTRHPEVNP